MDLERKRDNEEERVKERKRERERVKKNKRKKEKPLSSEIIEDQKNKSCRFRKKIRPVSFHPKN